MKPVRITGWHVLFGMLAFFGIIIGVNATMVTYAIGTFGGVEEPNAYVNGLNYNETLARRGAQKAAAPSVRVEVERGAGQAARIAVAIEEKGAALRDLTVNARLRHPTSSRRDLTAELEPQGDGRFAATLGDVAPGAWDVVITASRAGDIVLETRNRTWLP